MSDVCIYAAHMYSVYVHMYICTVCMYICTVCMFCVCKLLLSGWLSCMCVCVCVCVCDVLTMLDYTIY